MQGELSMNLPQNLNGGTVIFFQFCIKPWTSCNKKSNNTETYEYKVFYVVFFMLTYFWFLRKLDPH